MATIWRGTYTYSELAAKFGWLSVVVSAITLPLLVVYNWLLAFNPLLDCLVYHKIARFRYSFPAERGHDYVRKLVYAAPTNETGVSCFTTLGSSDRGGGKWFERYWGLLTVMDVTAHSDTLWEIKANWLTLPRAHVAIDFTPGAQILTIDLSIGISPFSWLSALWFLSAMGVFGVAANGTAGFLGRDGACVESITAEDLPDGVPATPPAQRFAALSSTKTSADPQMICVRTP